MNKTRTKRREPEFILQSAIFACIKEILNPDVLITCFPSGGGGRVRGVTQRKVLRLGGENRNRKVISCPVRATQEAQASGCKGCRGEK